MSTESVVTSVIAGVAAGVVSAVVSAHLLKQVDELAREEELADAKREGYNEGWSRFSQSAHHVKAAYERLFVEPEATEEGTAFKASRKA